MRVIIEKLAALYPDIDRSRVILKFAGINTLSISFAAAALVNWINIFEALDTNPQNMIDLFKEVLQDGDNISTNDKALFEKQIEELEAKLKESASELVIDGKIAPQAFDIHSVYSKRFAFINRDNVKRNFQKMLNDDGSPHVLMIEGKPGSGLTHSQLYIADVINATGNFKLAQILIEDNGNKNHYATGGELAEEISQIFNLTYTPEDEDKMALSKHTTFFTQLKELNEGEEAIGKIPIICLDGLYRIANPNLNSFISDLLHEAITYKKFYVILTLLDDNLMRRDWPDRLKEWPTLKIDSFSLQDVRSFVETIYKGYNEKVDLGHTPEEFGESWMDRNASQLSFNSNDLNVEDIGKLCTDWYKTFSSKIDQQL